MAKSIIQEMFQEAKKFVQLYHKKGANDVEINQILSKRPFIQGEFIINCVLKIGLKPFSGLPEVEHSKNYSYRNLQQLTKEWKSFIKKEREEGLVPSTYTYDWYFGATKLPRKIPLTNKKIENFAKKYKLECFYLTEKDKFGEEKLSRVCLTDPLQDLEEATLYQDGYWVGTTLELSEKKDARLYENIGKEIYGLKEKVCSLKRKINSLRRRWKGYWEEIDKRMENIEIGNIEASSNNLFEEE
jgi:hypothetical protein